MIRVEPGVFTLNIPINTSKDVYYIKKKVLIDRPYYIGAYEITNSQWDTCYKAKGCTKASEAEGEEYKNHPVVHVNWHDALEFTTWLSKVTKETYRLPTEPEWAYAAHAGREYKGEEIEYDYTNVTEETTATKQTQPMGFNSRNKWGMFDVMGNVWEWTLTCWYASEENILKNEIPKDLNTPEACGTRIAQGENRSHVPDFISDTYNGGCATLRPAANLGFRVLKEIKL